MAVQPMNYLTARGFLDAAPSALNEALRTVLDGMRPAACDTAKLEITFKEQSVLEDSGFVLESKPESDSLAKTAIKYAAIVECSLSSKEASERLGLASSRIRQMVSDHSLYSFLIGRNRFIPEFQFEKKRLIPNIEAVNKSLPANMHPVEAYNWYHLPHVDLFMHDDIEQTCSPLDWLKSGQDTKQVVFLASRL